MNNPPKNIKSILAGSIMILLITSGLFAMPRPAHALFGITFDPMVFAKIMITNIMNKAESSFTNALVVKEYGLDGIAWIWAKNHLKKITDHMIKATAKGSNGRPEFVTNLKKLTRRVGDRAASTSIASIRNNKQPGATAYDKSVAISTANEVQKKYSKNTAQTGFWSTHKETLSKTVPPAKTDKFFKGDFAAGGWNGWNAINSNQNNNPYSLDQAAQASMNKQVTTAQVNKKTEANWGQGFLSNTSCTKFGCSIQTPGSVIKAQLNHALGSSVSSLVSADELDEVVGSFAMGLVSKISGSGSSLLGVNNPGQGGGASYLKKYLAQPSPAAKNMAPFIKHNIAEREKATQGYLNNLHIILSSMNGAITALQQLIAYKIPPLTPSSKIAAYNECVVTHNSNVSAARTALTNVQSRVSTISTSIAQTNKGLTQMKKLSNQAKTANNTDLKNTTNQIFIQLVNNGELPTPTEIANIKIASSVSSGPLNSSGVADLKVSGGTVPQQMNLIAQNATNALNGITSCFAYATR